MRLVASMPIHQILAAFPRALLLAVLTQTMSRALSWKTSTSQNTTTSSPSTSEGIMDWPQVIFEVVCIWTVAISVTYVTVKYLSQKQP
mgnify:CR=1 FL=1